MKEVEYFKINETLSYQFFQMPKELFKNPYYKNKLSLESKVAYTFLLDRLQISKINNWFNDSGEIYLIYTRQELIDEIKISKTTATKVFKELTECNLIKEERLGQGFANRIYIGKMQSEDLQKFKDRTFISLKEELLEVQNSTSRSLKEYLNNTNINNTNTNTNTYNSDKKFFVDEKVSLYGKEINKLVEEYGMDKTVRCIVELNLYKSSNYKEYSSDYDAILRWVIKKVERDEKRDNHNNSNNLRLKNFSQREYDDLESFYDNL